MTFTVAPFEERSRAIFALKHNFGVEEGVWGEWSGVEWSGEASGEEEGVEWRSEWSGGASVNLASSNLTTS